MNWRTDKPTAKNHHIVAKLINQGYRVLTYSFTHKGTIHYQDGHDTVYGFDIEKWADLEEDETVTDYDELEEEVKKYINDNWECEHSNENAPLYLYDFSDKDLLDAARHFAKWGAEHTIKELEPKIKLAYGKVSMNPFDCSEAFEELLEHLKK